MSRAGREGTDRERIEEAHAVEHHLAWHNAQPGHAPVCAPNKTAEQKRRTQQEPQKRLQNKTVDAFRSGVFFFSIFFFCDMRGRVVVNLQTK
jgi:hypothetical protein